VRKLILVTAAASFVRNITRPHSIDDAIYRGARGTENEGPGIPGQL